MSINYRLTKNLDLVYVEDKWAVLDWTTSKVVVTSQLNSTEPNKEVILREYFDKIGRKSLDAPEIIVRYVRPGVTHTGHTGKHPALTVAATIDYETQRLTFGWSVCDKEDNFDRKVGRELAIKRLKEVPIGIEYNPNLSVVQNIVEQMVNEDLDQSLSKFRKFILRYGCYV